MHAGSLGRHDCVSMAPKGFVLLEGFVCVCVFVCVYVLVCACACVCLCVDYIMYTISSTICNSLHWKKC